MWVGWICHSIYIVSVPGPNGHRMHDTTLDYANDFIFNRIKISLILFQTCFSTHFEIAKDAKCK
jgi:hypothetical protein